MVIIIPMNEQSIRRLDYVAAVVSVGIAMLCLLCFNPLAGQVWMNKASEAMRNYGTA